MDSSTSSKGVITRDRLQEFVAFRRAARHQDAWLANPPTHATAPPPSATHRAAPPPAASAQEGALLEPSPTAVIPPPWVRALTSFADLEATVASRMDRLTKLHVEFFGPKFISDEEEQGEQKKIDQLAANVQQLLKELERVVLTGVKPADPNNADETRAAQNVQRHLTTRLTRLMNSFRDTQQLFADRIKKRDQKIKQFEQIGSKAAHEELIREEKVSAYLELGLTQADIAELLAEEAKQEEVSREVQNILESIRDLHEMFKDLNHMIVEQGTVLDRIDYHVQKTADNMKSGIVELQKAREHQKCCIQ